MKTKIRVELYLLSGFFLLVIDQILKYIARTNSDFTKYIIDPWLGWEYLGNPGIAFSLPIPNFLLIIITPLIILYLVILAIKYYKKKPLLTLGLILIIFGATSNFIDRVLFSLTIDYIRIITSVINLADVVIVAGAILVVLHEYHTKSPRQIGTNAV